MPSSISWSRSRYGEEHDTSIEFRLSTPAATQLPPITMSRPGTPSSKAAGTRSHRDDVLSFLDNLDSFEGSSSPSKDGASSSSASLSKPVTASAGSRVANTASTGPAATPGDNADDPQAVLDFLDEIVANRERRSVTPGNTGGLSSSAAGGSKKPSATAAGTSAVPRSTSRTTLRDGESSSATAGRSSTRDKDSTTVPPRKSGESARSMNMTPASYSSPAGQAAEKLQEVPPPESSSAGDQAKAGGWGWGSVWSQASNVLQQARTVAEEVRNGIQT